MKHVLAMAAALTAFLAAVSPRASADTIYVDTYGFGDYRKIQEGIDAASDGDVVLVGPGIYAGELNRDLDFDGREITVRSITGSEDTLIHCQDQGPAFRFHEYEDSLSVVQGFTITRTYGEAIRCYRSSPKIVDVVVDQAEHWGSGFWCYDASPRIVDCVFIGNTATGGPGVYCAGGLSYVRIRDCVIYDNGTYGIDICLSARAVIRGTTLFRNGGGIRCADGTDVVLSRCLLTFSTSDSGLDRHPGAAMDVSCTDIYGNAGGDWTEYTAGWLGVDGNICADPLFVDPDNLDLRLYADSPCAPYSPPNEECGRIGALNAISTPAVEPTTWGLIKAMFR